MTPRISWVVQVDRHEVSDNGIPMVERKWFQTEKAACAWANSQRREGIDISVRRTVHTDPIQSTEVNFDGLTAEEQGTADMPGEPSCV